MASKAFRIFFLALLLLASPFLQGFASSILYLDFFLHLHVFKLFALDLIEFRSRIHGYGFNVPFIEIRFNMHFSLCLLLRLVLELRRFSVGSCAC